MTVKHADARATFEGKVRALEGLRIRAVEYWDVYGLGPEPTRWDYGDWHHAVMGVELVTDAGPRTVTCTNTFDPYGVEVFADPIERHLVIREDGPARIGPDGESRWTDFLDTPVLHATTWWDRLELGPATSWTGEVVAPARAIELPTAIRLDFDSGPVWFAAAIPQPPSMESVFIPGDEIMIVCSAERMTGMGYTDPRFLT